MMRTRLLRDLLAKQATVYSLLVIAWLALLAWQGVEHARVEAAARKALATQARELSAALGVVMRSQGRFGFIPQPKLEAALNELVNSSEVIGVALLDVQGAVTAEAGNDGLTSYEGVLDQQSHWREAMATFVNLVALGPNTGPMPENAVVINVDEARPPGGEGPPRFRGGRGGPRRDDRMGPPPPWDELMSEADRSVLRNVTDGEPITAEEIDRLIAHMPGFMRSPGMESMLREKLLGRSLDEDGLRKLLPPMEDMHDRGRREDGPPPMRRPPWLEEREYAHLIEERGVHWFVVTLPDTAVVTEGARDLQARLFVVLISLLACVALALAWRAVARSSALEIALVRAAEEAKHLQELNMAAAGLVHETKNPLNLIRGMAQLVAREGDLPGDTRDRAVKITEEADRVTGRLNQFLDYSRPPEPSLARTDLDGLVGEVCGILEVDAEERGVRIETQGVGCGVMADAGMLRQVVFNLVLNALQAAPKNGVVRVSSVRGRDGRVRLAVCDNGSGVPEEQREEVFRPYFTTHADGTGLGLAVVRQIVSAHGWRVRCGPGPEGGACFTVEGMVVTGEDR